MGGKPDLSKSRNLLIVEGISDVWFFAEFVEACFPACQPPYIHNMNGKSILLRGIEVFLTPEILQNKERIAIICDADDNPRETFFRLQKTVENHVGQRVENPGDWSPPTHGGARIGIYVLPGDGSQGELETLIWKALETDSDLKGKVDCLRQYQKCRELTTPDSKHSEKALIGAYLAFECEEDPRVGMAARKRLIRFESPVFDRLRQFLSQLA